ncbi:nuclear transport factor 2 family protein [Pedobacter chinensis]|nr:nuclear transport factor 2 family protein [Pedobacter chinensis]
MIFALLPGCSDAGGKTNTETKTKPQSDMEDNINNNDELQILEATRQLTELMIGINTQGINKIVDNDFTLTHITGHVQSKGEWFAEIETERMRYYSYKEIKTSVKIEGDKATFVGQNLLDARIWGSRNKWRLQQTMQLEKRNGKWIVLKSVATTF